MVHPVASVLRTYTVESVQRFIRAGYDVNIVSPRGNGNTEFLRHLQSELQETEHDVLLLRDLGESGDALPVSFTHALKHAEPLYAPEQLRALLARWEKRVGSATCILLCDSPNVLTPVMHRLIALARESIRVQVVVHSYDPLTSLGYGGTTSTVELPLLTADETHAVLAYRLGAPLHQGTLARIYSKAAGLIKLSTLIVDVGRIEEKLRLVDGKWIAIGDLWSVAMQAEINVFDAHRSNEHTSAVQQLSLMGVTKLSDAVQEFGAETLHQLEHSGAVIVSATGRNHWVTVTPPLLAERDVRTMTVARHAELREQLSPELRASAVSGRFTTSHTVAELPGNDPAFLRRLSAHRAQRLREAEQNWRLLPNAEHASVLIGAMQPSVSNVEQMLALIRTARQADNPTEHLVYLRIWEAWIHGYVLGDLSRTSEILRADGTLGVYEGMLRAAHVRMLIDLERVPENALETLPVDDPELPVIVRNELYRCRAYVALVTGQPAVALSELSHVSSWAEDYFSYQQTVFLSLATLLDGDLVQAYEIALRGFELAYDELDDRALRMLGYVIALITVHRGDSAEANSITAIIRGLGEYPIIARVGHFGALVNAALVAAHTPEEAREALVYLREYEGPEGVLPATSRALPEARLAFLEGNVKEAADQCWQAALVQHDRGGKATAITSALHSLAYLTQKDRLETTEAWIAATESEFFGVQGDYYAAVFRAQPEQLAQILPRLISCGLSLLARQGITELRRLLKESGHKLSTSAAQQYRAVAEKLDLSEDATADSLQLNTALTSREYEVAQLLERGLTNREIQESLVLSIRTVENHVHRILAKLGVNSRSEATTMIRAWMAQHVR